MKILIDIPDSDVPKKQELISVDLHFIDGKVCECTYPFEELIAPRVGRWIPVSERLPSDCGYDWVLAQIQEPDTGYLWLPCVAEYRKGIDDWFSDANDISWLRKHEGAFKVIAWMPLPEPMKEGD